MSMDGTCLAVMKIGWKIDRQIAAFVGMWSKSVLGAKFETAHYCAVRTQRVKLVLNL